MNALDKAMAARRGPAAARLLAACCIAGLLAGCYETGGTQPIYATDYRDRHPITLKEGNRRVQVFLGRNRGGLNPSQRADVLSFAQLWKHEASSGIIVDVPKGGPTDRAAKDSMREVYSILAASGVPRNAVYVRTYVPSSSALVSINLNYTRLSATAGPCGLWPEDLGPGQDRSYLGNHPYFNLGCATQRNLASMVDNPADLVQPRGETPAYNARRSVAMDKYRKGENPSATYMNDGSNGFSAGKISDIGK
jgi:pilus assembly protein CpaD